MVRSALLALGAPARADARQQIQGLERRNSQNRPYLGDVYVEQLQKLLRAGCKVAIAEQTEDPTTAKGNVINGKKTK